MQTGTLARTHNLGDIELREEYLAVLHDLRGDMIGVQDSQFGEDINVGILESKTLLEERYRMIEVTKIRAVADNFVNVIRVLHNLKTTGGSKTKFALHANMQNIQPSRLTRCWPFQQR